MPNTIDEVIAYAKAHPKRDGKSWAGWCESFVWRAGGFTGSFGSALLAGNASGPLNSNWAQAPRGAIHYWAGVGGDGHVAFELGGGTLLMASSRTSNYGTALGTIHFTDYNLPLYRGWTMRHGTQTLAGATSTTAGSGFTELDTDDMQADERAALFEVRNSLRPGITGKQNQGVAMGALARAEAKNKEVLAKLDEINSRYLPGQAGVRYAGSIAAAQADAEAAHKALIAQNAALLAAVKTLAVGAGVDPEAFAAVVKAAVADALDDLTITLTAGA